MKLKLFSLTSLVLAIFLSSCNKSQSLVQNTTDQQTDQDSSYQAQKDSIIRDLQIELSYYQAEYESIVRELETVQSGTAGDKNDTVYRDLPIQTRRLSAGDDFIEVTGKWIWLDYTWKRGENTSSTKVKTDSSFTRIKDLRFQLREKEQYIKDLLIKIKKLEAQKMIKTGYTFWHLLAAFGIGAGVILLAVFVKKILPGF